MPEHPKNLFTQTTRTVLL